MVQGIVADWQDKQDGRIILTIEAAAPEDQAD